jgi:hypothetical protein
MSKYRTVPVPVVRAEEKKWVQVRASSVLWMPIHMSEQRRWRWGLHTTLSTPTSATESSLRQAAKIYFKINSRGTGIIAASKPHTAALLEMTETVLVTGGTGFLALEIIQQLLAAGRYKVRATVRSLGNSARNKPLLDLAPHPSQGQLELVEADLLSQVGWCGLCVTLESDRIV